MIDIHFLPSVIDIIQGEKLVHHGSILLMVENKFEGCSEKNTKENKRSKQNYTWTNI